MPGDDKDEFVDHVWITTFTDRKFHLHGDDPDDIDMVDIAHALSNQCRFTGHVRRFYSVAQHSCLVADIVRLTGGTFEEGRSALLHDASEAYLSDLAAPFKRQVTGYKEVELKIEARIEAKYNLVGKTDVVKKADWLALFVEAENLINADPTQWVGWDEHGEEALALRIEIIAQLPYSAENQFLDYAKELGII